jgi:lysophospholipase L1-like esterase
MKKPYFVLIFIFFQACKSLPVFVPDYPLNRFEPSILAFETEDAKIENKTNKILFVGSSSWYYWKTIHQDLAPLPILNRGFGGATIPELIHYAQRIIIPYQPQAIAIYAGENDICSTQNKSPQQVLQSYKQLSEILSQKLPNSKIYFVSLKRSPSRRQYWPQVNQTNQLIASYCAKKGQTFIDINPLLFYPNGTVKAQLYTKDSLHLNNLGYQAYTSYIKPILLQKHQ